MLCFYQDGVGNALFIKTLFIKEKFMTFAERMKEAAAKAGNIAQDFVVKAGDAAQDLGTKGKLLFEVKQLEGKVERLMEQLGAEVYKALAEEKLAGISLTTPGIKEIFAEIDKIQKEIDKKEGEMGKRE
jgi:hypothetical protein